MTVVRIVVASAALAAAAAGAAAAQDSLAISPGARIRVTVTEAPGFPLVGGYAGMRGETLLVALPGLTQPARYLMRTVRAVAVSQGRRRQVGPGAKLGAKIGAALGVVASLDVLLSTHGCTDASVLGQTDDQARAVCWVGVASAPFAGALGGAMYGALIGALIVHEDWLPLRMEGVHAVVMPTGRGTLGFGAAVAF